MEVPDEGLLWPEADSECSIYACFTDDEARQEEPVSDEEEGIAVLPELSEERPVAEEETPLDEAEQPEKDRFSEEDADLADDSVAEDKTADFFRWLHFGSSYATMHLIIHTGLYLLNIEAWEEAWEEAREEAGKEPEAWRPLPAARIR